MNRPEMLQRLRAKPGSWDVLVIRGGARGHEPENTVRWSWARTASRWTFIWWMGG